MQKYILGASPEKQTAMIRPIDDKGTTGDWRDFNAGIVYLASEVDARIAELEKALQDVKRFLEDNRWGTYRYMEGSDVYEDKDEALETINSALMETDSNA